MRVVMLNAVYAGYRKHALYAECRYAECRGANVAPHYQSFLIHLQT